MKNWIESLDQSELFDHLYYEAQSGTVFPGRIQAIEHYLSTGWRSGFNPSASFDTNFYLQSNADVRSADMPPLLHFLDFGRHEGRKTKLVTTRLAEKPVAPHESAWAALAKTRGETDSKEPLLDVVIPVYRGYDDTLACINSVLTSSNTTPFELIVINDKSPDERLVRALSEIAALGLITLVHNEANLGFVGTANHGLFLNASRDVLLLNSDAIVYGAWVDRMRRHVLSNPRVATVTAMSNNATILSYPQTLENNNCELELPYDELDAIFSQTLSGRSVEIPTGIGFCFYVTRSCLNEIGGFDLELFGRGYGEENDLCMRAAHAGWLNLAALDVFVRHTGEVSFSDSATNAKAVGLQALVGRWPDYLDVIRTYVELDPIAPARAKIDVARLTHIHKGRPVLLFVEHGWGGGTERHMDDLARLCGEEGIAVVRARPAKENKRLLELVPYAARDYDYPNLPKLPLEDVASAAELLRRCGVSHVHIHSLVSYELADLKNLTDIVARSGAMFDFTVHDYTPICPRITMADWGGAYCASPAESYCELCISRDGTPFGQVDIHEWRASYLTVLQSARRIIVPDSDVRDRLAKYRPEVVDSVLVRPHFEPSSPDVVLQRHLWQSAKGHNPVRRVGVIGAIGPHKGSRVLFATAAAALEEALPLEFILYGYCDMEEMSSLPNLRIKGRYDDDKIDSILKDDPCDVMLYLSIWPETYCYSLTIAFRNSIFPVSFDIGAAARRITEMKFGALLPLDMAFDARALAFKLLKMELQPPPYDLKDRLRMASPWVSAAAYYDMPMGPLERVSLPDIP